jgi:DNA polymerase III subunit delta'
LLITNPQQAFIAVAASILPVIENRIQQQIFLSLLEWYFSQYLQQQAQQSAWHQSRRLVEQFLHAQKLWQANVSFENSLEQLALIADSIIKGS